MTGEKIKVAVLAERLGTSAGGTEVYERCLLNALFNENRKYLDLDIVPILSYKRALDSLTPELRPACRVLEPGGKLSTLSKTWLEVKHIKPDVIHACFVIPPLFNNVPVVATIHDIGFIQFKNHYPFLLAWRLEKALHRTLGRAQKIVAVSESTRQDILKMSNIRNDKIVTVYNGLDTQFSQHTNSEKDKNLLLGYGVDKSYILYSGKLEPRKNVPVLIDAYNNLRQSGRYDGQLVIVGSSQTFMCKQAQERINSSLFRKDIIQTGYVVDAHVPLFYAKADVLCFPSLYEGFGFPVLEAMASGTPVVSSNTTCLPEIVGDAGLLVDPHDSAMVAGALYKTISDKKLRDQLVNNGKKRASAFTWEKTAQTMINLYREVAHHSPTGNE